MIQSKTMALLLLGMLVACSSGGPEKDDAGGPDVNTDVQEVGDTAPDDTGVSHAGVSAAEHDGVLVVTSDHLILRYRLDQGTFDLVRADGVAVVLSAESRVLFERAGDSRETGTSAAGSRAWSASDFEDPLGKGLRVVIDHEPEAGGPRLTTWFHVRSEASFITVQCVAEWIGEEVSALRVTRMTPLVTDQATGGALYVGPDPATHRILDNGFDMYFDFDGRVSAVGQASSLLFPPGTTSNWNMAIHDPVSDDGVVAGFLSNNRGGGLIAIDYDPVLAPSHEGRTGFTRFEAIGHYLEGRQPLATGDHPALESEVFYLDIRPESTLEGLEFFARRYAQRTGKVVRTDVPTGWNSWGGGSAAGGTSSNIDEAFILANLELAAKDFKPYGMKYFFIDDGWQAFDGDWWNNPDRFPDHDGVNGMKWMADRIRDKGMIPGIWIAPFRYEHDSALAAAHPDWAAEIVPLGALVVEPEKFHTLDVSNPEVLDWIEETFRRITQDWGYKWIKMDFSYFALFAANQHDPAVSASEAYVNALKRIREAIGPETFFLTVSGLGLCFEHGDGSRITLDNGPFWGPEESSSDPGIKVIYRTIARRYYMNHNVWLNHPDLLFYRDGFGLTLEEARAWTSAVALSGGIVKLGDTYQFMHDHPEARSLVTRLLPVYPASGRPLDLFEREFPEVWNLPVTREGRQWNMVGLFNWGTNRDIGAADYEEEQVRTIGVDLDAIGLDAGTRHLVFDAWERTWEWLEGPRLERSLDPRREAVLVLRPQGPDPEVVFTSRHLMGGAVEVHEETWDEATGQLTALIDTVAGDPIAVYANVAGRTLTGTEARDSSDPTQEVTDGLAILSFTPTKAPTSVTFQFGSAR